MIITKDITDNTNRINYIEICNDYRDKIIQTKTQSKINKILAKIKKPNTHPTTLEISKDNNIVMKKSE